MRDVHQCEGQCGCCECGCVCGSVIVFGYVCVLVYGVCGSLCV